MLIININNIGNLDNQNKVNKYTLYQILHQLLFHKIAYYYIYKYLF